MCWFWACFVVVVGFELFNVGLVWFRWLVLNVLVCLFRCWGCLGLFCSMLCFVCWLCVLCVCVLVLLECFVFGVCVWFLVLAVVVL